MNTSVTEFDIRRVEDVLWSITDICNLKCIYCSVDAGSCLPIIEPSNQEIDRVISQLQKLPNLRSIILSGGEALLSRFFDKILREASRISPCVYVITNGFKLPSRAVEALATYRPTVMVSIDSINEDINRTTRGDGVLQRTLNTVQALQSMNLTVIVIMVVTRVNIETVPSDLSFLYDYGIRNVLLQQLHCEGRAGKDIYLRLSPQPDQIEILFQSLTEFERSHPDVNLDCNEICFFPMRRAAHAEKCDPALEYLPQRLFMCGAGFNFFAIKTNGDVIPCNALRSCVFGNLLKEDIGRILEFGREARNVRRLRLLRVDNIGPCKDCVYSPMCDGGCRADVLHLTGDILGPHPYCPIARTNV